MTTGKQVESGLQKRMIQRRNKQQQQDTNDKLDELLDLSRQANFKIDRIGEQVEDMDGRLKELEKRMDKLGIKAIAAGGLGGAVVSVGIHLIKAHFGG